MIVLLGRRPVIAVLAAGARGDALD